MRGFTGLVLSLCFSGALVAQTPGVAGVNDFWVTPGGTPGGFSCKSVTMITPLTITLNTSSAPSMNYVIIISGCRCAPCLTTPPMGTSGCLPGPTSACPSSNQFLELFLAAACPSVLIAGAANGAGIGAIPISVPLTSPPVTLGMQTVFLGPPTCVVAPFNLLFSQGWNVTFM